MRVAQLDTSSAQHRVSSSVSHSSRNRRTSCCDRLCTVAALIRGCQSCSSTEASDACFHFCTSGVCRSLPQPSVTQITSSRRMTRQACTVLSRGRYLAQAELIGTERDGKRDEKMRAKLHAAWLEQQDTARVEALLHGVKNGFRKKRSALDDEASSASLHCNLKVFLVLHATSDL